MRIVMIFLVAGSMSFMMDWTSTAHAQGFSVFDTVYVPPGYSDGSGEATVFLPDYGNGIGVVLVHGCTGIRTDSRIWCDTLASYGYTAMSIEYPDPCVNPLAIYPKKARAAKLAVEFLRRNAMRFGITTGKIVGWGASNGAQTWGETIIWDNDDAYFQTDSTIDDHLDAAVLLYGEYEPYRAHTPADSAIWNIYFGNDTLRAAKGNCIRNVANITTPTLFMHGTADSSNPYQQSVQLYDSLAVRGRMSQLVLFNGQPHSFDLTAPYFPNAFTPAGLVAKDSTLSFLRRTVAPQLKIHVVTPSIDFMSVLFSESDTSVAAIRNIGSGPLSVNSILNANQQFTLLNLPSFPTVILAGASLSFKVEFHPNVQGVVRDTIRIVTNDSLHPVVRITLRGKGIPALIPASAGVMYATSAATPEGYLYTINTSTGALTAVGTLGFPEINSMAIRHSDRIIYGSYASSTSTTLYRINSESGDAIPTRVIPVGNLRAIAFSPGDTLFGATTTGSLYQINVNTGEANLVGTTPGLTYYGLSFRPGLNQLWASVRTPIDSIYRLNTVTGAATFMGITGFNALTFSLAFNPGGGLLALIDNGSGEDYLASLDTVNAAGTIIAGPLSVNYLQAIAMRTDSTASGVEGTIETLPAMFALHQNYPNPFNPNTTIKYDLPKASFVSLLVYNTLGQQVSQLVNEQQQPGYHEVAFLGDELASGVYFYRLQAGSFVATKKLLLLK